MELAKRVELAKKIVAVLEQDKRFSSLLYNRGLLVGVQLTNSQTKKHAGRIVIKADGEIFLKDPVFVSSLSAVSSEGDELIESISSLGKVHVTPTIG